MSGNAAISDANFNVVGLAVGTASTQHVMGIGGLGKDALILEAKRNLYSNYPLKKGQALANVTVDIKRSMFPFVFKTLATVSADVIDFNASANDSSFMSFNKEIRENSKASVFLQNERVKMEIKGVIYSARILKSDKAKSQVLFENSKGNFKLKNFSNKRLYSDNSIKSEVYHIGDGIRFLYNNENYVGNIEAIYEDSILVSTILSKDDKRLIQVNIKDVED